jgi:hypothetical protein
VVQKLIRALVAVGKDHNKRTSYSHLAQGAYHPIIKQENHYVMRIPEKIIEALLLLTLQLTVIMTISRHW